MSTRCSGAAAGAANANRALSGCMDSAAARAVEPCRTVRRVKPLLKGSAKPTDSSPHSQPACRPSGRSSCGTAPSGSWPLVGPSGRYLSFVMAEEAPLAVVQVRRAEDGAHDRGQVADLTGRSARCAADELVHRRDEAGLQGLAGEPPGEPGYDLRLSGGAADQRRLAGRPDAPPLTVGEDAVGVPLVEHRLAGQPGGHEVRLPVRGGPPVRAAAVLLNEVAQVADTPEGAPLLVDGLRCAGVEDRAGGAQRRGQVLPAGAVLLADRLAEVLGP